MMEKIQQRGGFLNIDSWIEPEMGANIGLLIKQESRSLCNLLLITSKLQPKI